MFSLEIVSSPLSKIEAITDQTNPESDTLTWDVTAGRDKFLTSYSPAESDSPDEVTDLNYTFNDSIPGTTNTFSFVTVGSDGNQSTGATKEVAWCELGESLFLTFQGFYQLRDYKMYYLHMLTIMRILFNFSFAHKKFFTLVKGFIFQAIISELYIFLSLITICFFLRTMLVKSLPKISEYYCPSSSYNAVFFYVWVNRIRSPLLQLIEKLTIFL